eukprot:1097520_1
MLPRQSQPHSSDRSRQLRRVILIVVYCVNVADNTVWCRMSRFIHRRAHNLGAISHCTPSPIAAILGLWIQSVALNGLNYSLFGITVKTEKKETETVKSCEP